MSERTNSWNDFAFTSIPLVNTANLWKWFLMIIIPWFPFTKVRQPRPGHEGHVLSEFFVNVVSSSDKTTSSLKCLHLTWTPSNNSSANWRKFQNALALSKCIQWVLFLGFGVGMLRFGSLHSPYSWYTQNWKVISCQITSNAPASKETVHLPFAALIHFSL